MNPVINDCPAMKNAIHGFTYSTTVTDFDPIGSKQTNLA